MTNITAVGRSDSRLPSGRALHGWLVLLCLMVFVMVLLGGATRLTDSGLSMVEWQPLTVLPPLGEDAWQAEFAKYQASPEFRHKTTYMTLGEFKGIFWLEYVHRLWGRLIGAAVLLPLAWFALRGAVDRRLGLRMGGLFVLGGLQGVLGWYMVRSGLVDHPEVSQYRLAAHLGLAIVLYAALVWMALTLRRPGGALDAGGRRAAGLAALVFLTMLSGAFVAGLDAGLTYNTFPLMDGALVPRGLGVLEPAWRNHFENITAVQFQHRVLALATVGAAVLLRASLGGGALTPRRRRAANAVVAAALAQAGLGIATLVLVVPVPLAVAHQGGSLIVLAAVLWLMAESRTGVADGR
ncbi:COX15/CtaA family protein [Novispirillum sp. DQ9]|uniref:COX15/CtaA family protein n=1 Tax=Novispirillum sp. DQ9 TaxID=3398612 RepID=UPI003C7D857A